MGQGSDTLGGDSYDFYEFEDDYEFNNYPIKKNKESNLINDKKVQRGAKVEKNCDYCGISHIVRKADLDRGWGKYCSKSCKAKEQECRTGKNMEYILSKL